MGNYYYDTQLTLYTPQYDVVASITTVFDGSKLVRSLMGDDYVILHFIYNTSLTIEVGTRVYVAGVINRWYVVTERYKPTYNSTTGVYDYDLKAEAHYMIMKNKKVKYLPQYGGNELSFNLTSKIMTHIGVLQDNIAHYDLRYNNGSGVPSGELPLYQIALDQDTLARIDTVKAKLVTYDNISFIDALTNIAQTFECEWWVVNNFIYFGICEKPDTVEYTEFQLDDNVSEMSQSESSGEHANKIFVFGSTRNIPRDYYKKQDEQQAEDTRNISAVVQRRLRLPSDASGLPLELQNELTTKGYVLSQGCLYTGVLTGDTHVTEEGLVEGVYVTDDVYPKIAFYVRNTTTYTSTVEEEGETITRTYWRIEYSDEYGAQWFSKDYILPNEALHIVFETGTLTGMDFECQYNEREKYFEVVANENYGRFLPDDILHPCNATENADHGRTATDDRFMLYNWDSRKYDAEAEPHELIHNAEIELVRAAIKYLDESRKDSTVYSCKEMVPQSEISHYDFSLRNLGDRILLKNVDGNATDQSLGGRPSRITGMEIDLVFPFDGPVYKISEKADYIYQSHVEGGETLTFNGKTCSGGGRGSGGGTSIYLIKHNDVVEATDYNAYSARRTDDELEKRISAEHSDDALGLITFLAGLAVGSGYVHNPLGDRRMGIDEDGNAGLLDVLLRAIMTENYTGPDIISDRGFQLWEDEKGYSHIIADFLSVRMKAFFASLEIRKVQYSAGNILLGGAGANIELVKPLDNNGNIITSGPIAAYRCYFKGGEDGTVTHNEWHIGDQAMCRTFNIDAGRSTNVSNKAYWRLVIRTGSSELDVNGNNETKKYHYVDLCNVLAPIYTDEQGVEHRGGIGYDISSNDIPEAGDAIAQVGNQIDPQRMNIIQMCATGDDAPSISEFAGINNYSLANHRTMKLSPQENIIASRYWQVVSSAGTGASSPLTCYRGEWDESSVYGYYDEVTYNGSTWLCVVDSTTITPPSDSNPAWQKRVSMGEPGLDGNNTVMLVITSNNGTVFKNGGTPSQITLTATAYRGEEDVTSEIDAFTWTKTVNGETTELPDTTRTIIVNAADVASSAMYEVSANVATRLFDYTFDEVYN